MEINSPRVNPQALFAMQGDLKRRLLGCGRLASDERGLAAEMLLYLDEPLGCWSVCAAWLLARTGADRVDAGFASSVDAAYLPMIERRRDDIALPSVLGTTFDAREEAILTVWESPRAVVYQDVATDRRLGACVRMALLAAGTKSKMAVAVRDRGRDVGLLCVDSQHAFAWSEAAYDRIDWVAREVIGPVLGAAEALAATVQAQATSASRPSGPKLTPAELRVAKLVLTGCSYKEIARKLDRSCSTIDHQLRSMREKLGVSSTAKLMRDLPLYVANNQNFDT